MRAKVQHPNAPENHPARCTYRQATGSPAWNICDCGVYSQWLIAGAPAMAKCAADTPPPPIQDDETSTSKDSMTCNQLIVLCAIYRGDLEGLPPCGTTESDLAFLQREQLIGSDPGGWYMTITGDRHVRRLLSLGVR